MGGGLLYFDGVAWGDVTCSVFGANPTWRDVQGSSASDVWALTSQTGVFQFDGTRWWRRATLPQLFYSALTVVAPGDVWIGGGSGSTNGGILYHSSGGGPFAQPADQPLLDSVQAAWGSAPDDVWFATDGNQFIRWNGAGFFSYPNPSSWTPRQIRGSGPGFALAAGGGLGQVLFWDGATWEVLSSPFSATNIGGGAVAVSAPGEGWIFGGETFGAGVVARFNGTALTKLDAGGAGVLNGSVGAAVAFPNGDVWSLGDHSFARLKRP